MKQKHLLLDPGVFLVPLTDLQKAS